MSLTTQFLGKGLSFPLRVDPNTRDFAGAKDEENVEGSIIMFLATNQGERVFAEDYGMPPVMFESEGPGLEDVYRDSISRGLNKYEPRIRVMEVNVTSGYAQGGLYGVRFDIRYLIRKTNVEANLVYFRPRAEEGDDE